MERIISAVDKLSQLMDLWGAMIPILAGGLLDYVNQVRKGKKSHDIATAALHLGMALFFGWLSATFASGMDYSDDLVKVFGGLGGFLGVRTSDLVVRRLGR